MPLPPPCRTSDLAWWGEEQDAQHFLSISDEAIKAAFDGLADRDGLVDTKKVHAVILSREHRGGP